MHFATNMGNDTELVGDLHASRPAHLLVKAESIPHENQEINSPNLNQVHLEIALKLRDIGDDMDTRATQSTQQHTSRHVGTAAVVIAAGIIVAVSSLK